jgi:hypothetical protein
MTCEVIHRFIFNKFKRLQKLDGCAFLSPVVIAKAFLKQATSARNRQTILLSMMARGRTDIQTTPNGT